MIISVLQDEHKKDVCLTSEAISVLVQNNHTVLIEGEADSVAARAFMSVGAYIINTKEELLDRGDLIIKRAWPTDSEVDYLNGEAKIFFTKLKFDNQALIKKILAHNISLINYLELRGFKKKKFDPDSRIEFSNYILPFLLELASKGLKSLVEDEVLRAALTIMHGKVYSSELADKSDLPCYEF